MLDAPPVTRRPLARALLVEARPKQWVKNLLVFAAPAAAGVLDERTALLNTVAAFACFCLAASGTYFLNDAADIEADRLHPKKRLRPIAAGEIPLGLARVLGVAMIVGSVAAGYLVNWHLAVVIGSYVALTTTYSIWMKHVAVLDIVGVAAGFVLRTIAGATAVDVPISDWFFIVVTFGSLLMVVGKRRAELEEMGADAAEFRPTLGVYPKEYLAHIQTVCTAVVLVGYCLWAFSTAAEASARIPWFELSIVPFGVAVLRYTLLLDTGHGGAPEDVVLSDRPLLIMGALWVLIYSLGVYAGVSQQRRAISGWANTAQTSAEVAVAADIDELAGALSLDAPRGLIARGLGRSYGDPAQNAGGLVVDTTHVSGITNLDLDRGIVTAEAGTSLDALMRWLVPLGWFVPVTPGTRQVTVGGAIASDIHGKNHHTAGSWCDAVEAITIVTPAHGRRRITPTSDPELFWATAGGMGLTGIILDATFRLSPIETSLLSVDTDRTPDLDTTLDLMETGDHRYHYSVAWIDLMAKGASMGRSILGRGRFAGIEQLSARQQRDPLEFRSSTLLTAPKVVPPNLVNPVTIRAFNEAWYRRAPKQRRDELQGITEFFHPLDLVDRWNRIYGATGLLQWQFVIPLDAMDELRAIIGELSVSGCPSFLAVLKRMGPGNPGPLSFPMEGMTLAFDVPAKAGSQLGPLLDRLDERVVACGGRLYLAKDSRMRPELLGAMYPRLDEWLAVRREVDPKQQLMSDLARRLRLS